MAKYQITSPSGKTYEITAPDNASQEDVLSYAQQQFSQMEQPQQQSTATGNLMAPVAGANELLPSLLGMPVDLTTQALNLGIAGARKGMEAIGAGQESLPGYINQPFMGSEWFKHKIEQGYQAANQPSPFALQNPQDPTQQNLKMAGGILASGLTLPATGPGGMLKNVARMIPAAGGAIAGKEMFPDSQIAPIIGMLAGGMAAPAVKAAISKMRVSPKEAFVRANELGYRVPPTMAKGTMKQQAIEGFAGPVPTKQRASLHNQEVTNNLIKKDIGYPMDVPLSKEGLDAIRQQAGQAYEPIKNLGIINTDKAFLNDIMKVSNMKSSMAEQFPGLVKKDIQKLTKNFTGKQYSSDALVEVMKQLRKDASSGIASTDPAISGMARAQKRISDAIEGLLERNIPKSQSDLLNNFRESRQRIAKTYSIESALKGENVDAVSLGRQLEKGKPLSGLTKDVANFGIHFKGAAQVNPPQTTNFRPMDYAIGTGGAIATQNPLWLAAVTARPLTRTLILSKPYQNMLAKVYPKEISAIKAMPKEAQIVAITNLVNQIKEQNQQGTNQ